MVALLKRQEPQKNAGNKHNRIMPAQEKHRIRKKFLDVRKNIPESKKHLKSREIVKNFYSNIPVPNKSVVAGFIPFANEVDIKLLLEMYDEEGKDICLPSIEQKNEPMVFRKYKIGSSLQKNSKYNFMEPTAENEDLIPNTVIVPLVAFDSAGTRLGMGGGYYDRTLEYLSGFAEFMVVGVAFSEQQTEYIRPESFDYKLDAIVTDKKVFVYE